MSTVPSFKWQLEQAVAYARDEAKRENDDECCGILIRIRTDVKAEVLEAIGGLDGKITVRSIDGVSFILNEDGPVGIVEEMK